MRWYCSVLYLRCVLLKTWSVATVYQKVTQIQDLGVAEIKVLTKHSITQQHNQSTPQNKSEIEIMLSHIK